MSSYLHMILQFDWLNLLSLQFDWFIYSCLPCFKDPCKSPSPDGKQDFEKVLFWHRKAAEGGNSTGMTNVGYAYEKELGVKKDCRKARIWYQMSAVSCCYIIAPFPFHCIPCFLNIFSRTRGTN